MFARRRILSLLAAITAAAIAVPMLSGTPVVADSEQDRVVAENKQDSMTLHERAAVRAFRRAFPGVSETEALARINAGQERVRLLDHLATTYPDAFGGSWYDGATDVQHLQATTSEAAAAFAKAARDHGVRAKVHRATYSYQDLTTEMKQALYGTHPTLGNAAKGRAGIDIKENRVVVAVSQTMLDRINSGEVELPNKTKAVLRQDIDVVYDSCHSRRNCGRPM